MLQIRCASKSPKNAKITLWLALGLGSCAATPLPPQPAGPMNTPSDAPRVYAESLEEAPETKPAPFGKQKLSLEYTADSRSFNTLNLTGTAPLRYQWNLWGFIDLHSSDGGPSAEPEDSSRYFIELDLKRKLWSAGGVVFELNDATGDNNVLGRAGLFYQAPWSWLEANSARLFFKAFPYETDGRGWQASFAFSKRFPEIAGDRISIGGFFDANFNSGPNDDDNNIVTETQVRYEISPGINLFAEFRRNEFLADRHGVGMGLQASF